MFGFLNVYKPKGKTSHDVVVALRRVTKVKQIGHTGTLDPFAEGVLPICIGKATRLIEYLDDDKAYIGIIQLGESTTTFDNEGEGVNFSDKIVTLDEIETVLNNFRGEILQLPPIYSAIKVKGKKLYEYARMGEEVEIQPRKVTISELKILNYNQDKKQLELYIACSKGTYIRSLANDIGKSLNVYGHLIKLTRVKAGLFEINKSVKLDELQNLEQVNKNLITPLDYLNYPKYELNSKELELVSHGMEIKPDNELRNGIIVLVSSNNIAGIGELKNGKIKCKKVFI